MSDTSTQLTNDPSLKRYFKFMLTNRKMSVQFTSRKIREIIETDLGIKLQPPQSLYARVCIEAFAYYMQSWPEWNHAIKSQYSDALYEGLINYLKTKLMYLKKKEQNFKQMNIEKNTLTLPKPGNIQIVPQKGLKKVKAPYCLNVSVPLCTTNVSLRNYGTNHIYLEFSQPDPVDQNLEIRELLNYPFVSAEFNVPGLIHFIRSCPFNIRRLLQTKSDDPIHTDSSHIISIVESDKNSPHKVYSYQTMAALFQNLNRSLVKYNNKVADVVKLQISVLCDLFLLDIFESNQKKTTVCEGSTVDYNIGKSTYCVNSCFSTLNILGENLVYTKLIKPIVSYNLVSCDITHDNITDNGQFDFFKFLEKKDSVKEYEFLHNINNCVSYKCILCNISFSLHDLKKHVNDNHPLEQKYWCTKCWKSNSGIKHLQKKWKHDCARKHTPTS